MGKIKTVIGGLGIGVLAMYFFDPQRGRTRRAMVEDKLHAVWKAKVDANGIMLKDARNRLTGLAHRTRARFQKMTPTDKQLVERIRSKMGHCVSHPGALTVEASGGKVAVRGPIVDSEVDALMDCIWQVEGVESVEHLLERHESTESVSALQGEIHEPSALSDNWTPAAALGVGIAGGLITMLGISRRGVVGSAMKLAGTALLAKSFREVEGKRIAQHVSGEGWV